MQRQSVRRPQARRSRRKRLPSALSPDEAVRLVDDRRRRRRWRCATARCSSSRIRRACACPSSRGSTSSASTSTTGEVRVWGKGSKERIVPVGAPALRRRSRAWLAARARDCAAADESALFVGRTRQAHHRRARSQRRLARWAVAAGARRGTCIRTCCGIRSPRTCCSRRATCAPCRRCSGTRASPARRSTRTSTSRRSRRSTTPRIRARARRRTSAKRGSSTLVDHAARRAHHARQPRQVGEPGVACPPASSASSAGRGDACRG